MGKLADKVAIVTGGRGIGRLMTHAYLQEDAGVVVIAARKKAEIEEGLVEETGPEKALAILADVTDPTRTSRSWTPITTSTSRSTPRTIPRTAATLLASSTTW